MRKGAPAGPRRVSPAERTPPSALKVPPEVATMDKE
jgi:hypothetical protein